MELVENTVNTLSVSFPLYLVGLPGSGKSRVGRLLAKRLGVPHFDTDVLVEEKVGKKVNQIFSENGEPFFRQVEAEVVEQTANKRAVVSLGGGAIETPQVHHFLCSQTVVWIKASMNELLRRVKGNDTRPLLSKNPTRTLQTLAAKRTPLYESAATLTVKSTRGSPRKVVDQVMNQIEHFEQLTVKAPQPYSVTVGAGSRVLVPRCVPADTANIFFVTPETLCHLAKNIIETLRNRGWHVTVFLHPEGENAKELDVVAEGWKQMGDARIGRRDMVITFGGGATTDMGGFLAATWLRGIRVQHIPTSLLGMVDAAIGGKTGINTVTGKNLVGSFHDPTQVTIDPELLVTLPQEEYASGLAEILKAGFISDPQILELFETNPDLKGLRWATTRGKSLLSELIYRSVKVKTGIVSSDRLESGLRETLNFGHTLAHALEKAGNYSIRHGEAVAVGSVFAAELSVQLGVLDLETVKQVRHILGLAGLPTSHEGNFNDLLKIMRSDKKVRSNQLRFVLLDALGSAFVREVEEKDLRSVSPKVGIDARNIVEGNVETK